MAPSKMPCKNNAAFSYTGKEMSPLGLGFCADAESVNKEMLGRDDKLWVVGVKNGNKMWMRAPEPALVKEEPVMPEAKETVVEPKAEEDSDEEELPPLEEMTEVEEDADEAVLEDPFGWSPTETLEVAEEEPKAEESKPEPKKRGRPAKPKAEKSSEEPKVEGEPKKRGRPAKPKAEKSSDESSKTKEGTDEPKAEKSSEETKVEGEPKKRGRPAKSKDEKSADEPKAEGEVKPKRKYTRKPKLVEGEIVVEEVEKKERKPRAKTEYNEFLGKTMKELREKHKDNSELKTTDYMKMAIAEWKTYKISKVAA